MADGISPPRLPRKGINTDPPSASPGSVERERKRKFDQDRQKSFASEDQARQQDWQAEDIERQRESEGDQRRNIANQEHRSGRANDEDEGRRDDGINISPRTLKRAYDAVRQPTSAQPAGRTSATEPPAAPGVPFSLTAGRTGIGPAELSPSRWAEGFRKEREFRAGRAAEAGTGAGVEAGGAARSGQTLREAMQAARLAAQAGRAVVAAGQAAAGFVTVAVETFPVWGPIVGIILLIIFILLGIMYLAAVACDAGDKASVFAGTVDWLVKTFSGLECPRA
ncbi:MAG: hypothetical protein HY420_03930 [Candidatus Kerfeldbacteria bacterium]|nr:hypothetical protein [Candidatus Kerfeldbacteria bacterium]